METTFIFFNRRVFLLILLCLGAAAADNEVARGTVDYVALFGKIEETFVMDELGCEDRTGPVDAYTWRVPGYGSNVNLMILPWLNAILNGRKDLALVLVDDRKTSEPLDVFEMIECREASNGVETIGGFPCLFSSMPHVCVFQTEKNWESFMIDRNISIAEQEEAVGRRHVKEDIAMIADINHKLWGSGIDILRAKAVLLKYLHLYWQPWVKRDVHKIVQEPLIEALKGGPYVGMHIRRGDKLHREAEAHDVQEYLQMANSYINNSTKSTISVDDIRGIWVSSDDENAVFEVKKLSRSFFPYAELDKIVWISGRAFQPTKKSSDAIPTRTNRMEYKSYVVFFAELEMLSQANVFVGTFSSNVARMVVLMREAKRFPRSSSLSVDRPVWYPGRRIFVSK